MATKPRKTSRSRSKSAPVTDFSKTEDLAAYREMLLIRRFEEKAGQLHDDTADEQNNENPASYMTEIHCPANPKALFNH